MRLDPIAPVSVRPFHCLECGKRDATAWLDLAGAAVPLCDECAADLYDLLS